MINIAIVYHEQAVRNLSGWCVGGAQARHPVGFLRKGNAYRISGESSKCTKASGEDQIPLAGRGF